MTGSTFRYPRDLRPSYHDEPKGPKDPHPEVPGDVFDRQRVIEHFDQAKVESAVAFVVGTGGIGQNVAIALCRLGVGKIFLLDRDDYEATNLTRQLCGSVRDVGRRKVDVARDNLNAVHNLRSEIVTIHTDAVLNWGKIVEVAKQCTVLFNAIDYGGVADLALNNLCKELQIPYVSGSSYAYSIQVDYSSGKDGQKCWRCLNNVASAFKVPSSRERADTIAEIDAWMRKAGKVALDAETLTAYVAAEMDMQGAASYVMQALAAIGARTVATDDGGEAWSKFADALREAVEGALMPGRVSKHASIDFIPREAHFPTRNVGSWCCVCVAAGMMIVNAWIQGLTGIMSASFPNYANVSLVDSSIETDRTFGGSPESDEECPVCREAALLRSGSGAAAAGAGTGADA